MLACLACSNSLECLCSGRAALPRDSLIGQYPSVPCSSPSSGRLEMGVDLGTYTPLTAQRILVARLSGRSGRRSSTVLLPMASGMARILSADQLVSSTTCGSLLDLQYHMVHLALPSSTCSAERRSKGLPTHGCYRYSLTPGVNSCVTLARGGAVMLDYGSISMGCVLRWFLRCRQPDEPILRSRGTMEKPSSILLWIQDHLRFEGAKIVQCSAYQIIQHAYRFCKFLCAGLI